MDVKTEKGEVEEKPEGQLGKRAETEVRKHDLSPCFIAHPLVTPAVGYCERRNQAYSFRPGGLRSGF